MTSFVAQYATSMTAPVGCHIPANVRRQRRRLHSTGGTARFIIRLLIKGIISTIARLIGHLRRIRSRKGREHSFHVRACRATSGPIRYL